MLILEEFFQCSGICEIKVCPMRCPVFVWWHWHIFDYVLVEFDASSLNFIQKTETGSFEFSIPLNTK